MHYGKKVMLWATVGPGIRVDATLTRTTFLKIVADQVHLFMAVVFPGGWIMHPATLKKLCRNGVRNMINVSP